MRTLVATGGGGPAVVNEKVKSELHLVGRIIRVGVGDLGWP